METLGIYKVRDSLKVAHLKHQKDSYQIVSLDTIMLPDEQSTGYQNHAIGNRAVDDNTGQMHDPFVTVQPDYGSSESALEIVYEYLSKYSVDKISVALAISESEIHYTQFFNEKGLKGKPLIEAIRESVSGIQQPGIGDRKQLRYVNGIESHLIMMNYSGSDPVLDLFLRVKNYLNGDCILKSLRLARLL